jgi:hypothetical protein
MAKTQADFNQFKEQVLSQKIGRKKVTLGELRLITDSVVEYAGLNFVLSSSAFTSLTRLSGISKQMRANLIKEYGNDFASKMVSTLTKVMSNSKKDIVMLINLNKRTIINFVQSDNVMLPNETYLNTIEKVLDNTNLRIDNFHLRDDGSFTVSTLGDNSQWGLRGIENSESFEFGLSFENSAIKGTKMSPFNKRLICTNGMIGLNFAEETFLANTKSSWDHFYKTVDILKKSNFKPTEFEPRLKRVMTSTASLSEVENARNIIKANSKIGSDELERFIPIYSTQNSYKKIGINTELLIPAAKKNAVTDVKYWDMINGLTDFASHNYGFQLTNADNIQRFAGKCFASEPDLGNLVPNPFK